MFRSFIIAAACAAVSVQAASAADLPTKAPTMAAPVASTWTGFYAGVQAGYEWGSSVQFFTGAGNGTTDRYNVNGGLGGVTVGYNWQFRPQWLVGLEADWSWMKASGTTSTTATYFCGATGPGCTTTFADLGTVRARLGYAAGNMLIFGSGGYAVANLSTGCCNGPLNDSYYRNGWAAGGGIEYAVDRRWSAKLEYLRAEFGSYTWDNRPGCATINCQTDAKMNVLRVGLNYRPGW